MLKSLTVVDHSGGQVASVRVLDNGAEAETVRLKVGMTEAGRHDLAISYVAEMSGWRPTYRIVAEQDGRIRLQGLAVVDNSSGEPWNDIIGPSPVDEEDFWEPVIEQARSIWEL